MKHFRSVSACQPGSARFCSWHFPRLMAAFPHEHAHAGLAGTLKELDADSATKLERLVRDAMALASPSKSPPGAVDACGWPVGFFEETAGCFANEPFAFPATSKVDPSKGAQ